MTTKPVDQDRPDHSASHPTANRRPRLRAPRATSSWTALSIGQSDSAAVKMTLWCSLHWVHIPSVEQQEVDRLERLRHLRDEGSAAAYVARPPRELAVLEAVLHDAVPAQRLQILVGHPDVAAEGVLGVEGAGGDGLLHHHVEELGRVGDQGRSRQQALAQEEHGARHREQQRLCVLPARW